MCGRDPLRISRRSQCEHAHLLPAVWAIHRIVSLLANPRMYGGNVFDAVYVVPPSARLDSTWQHLAKCRAKRGQKEEDLFFNHWDAERVQRTIDEPFELTAHRNKKTTGQRRECPGNICVSSCR